VNESEAIRRLQAGDKSALASLYTAFALTAIRTAFLITRRRTAAEDAVQEAFVQVLRSVGSLRDPASFRPWFFRIVINAAKRSTRHAARTLPLAQSGNDPVDLSGLTPEEAAIGVEEIEQVRAVIAALNDTHREILILRYYADLSEAEIGQALGLPPGTVKSRLYRAREAVHARLTTHPDDEPAGRKG
jgi:RNA polymerase sigma factor (sigma-70 family)